MSSWESKISTTDRFNNIGMIARWQPVHLGHASVLHALCDRASSALIGIGSSNKHDFRNPFRLEEITDMIRLVSGTQRNYELIPVPDLDDGPRWREMFIELFGSLDLFVTANPYVSSLLAGDYQIIHPIEFIPESERIAVNGSLVRREMARGGRWQELVPEEVADYIAARHLDERFRQDFGLQTLALETIVK